MNRLTARELFGNLLGGFGFRRVPRVRLLLAHVGPLVFRAKASPNLQDCHPEARSWPKDPYNASSHESVTEFFLDEPCISAIA